MKKGLIMLTVIVLAFSVSGCAGLQKKFTRKKKAPVSTIPRYKAVKKYQKKPTQELYQRHYVFWKTWHSELLQVMGQNHKKDMSCIEEAIENLKDMRNMLTPEAASKIAPHISELEKVRAVIAGDEASTYNTAYIRRILEKEEKEIAGGFRYKKVKDCLKKGFDDGA